MPHNTEAIQKVLKAYYIMDMGKLAPVLHQRSQAEPQDHQALLDAGFKWDEKQMIYSDPRMGGIVSLPNGIFVWMYNTFGKILKNSEKLNIWIDGRCETFLGELMAAYGQNNDVKFNGNGERPPKPQPQGDETDQLIAKLKRQAGSKGTLPSDTMIDLGLKAKKDNNEKLLAFLKTMKPLNENTMKQSQLDALIREIVRGIVKEGYTDDPKRQDYWKADEIGKSLWGSTWAVNQSKEGEEGRVFRFNSTDWKPGLSTKQFMGNIDKGQKVSRFLWKTPKGEWKSLDPATKKWTTIEPDVNPSEMTGTGAVSGISTPNAFQKRKIHEGEEEEEQIDEMTTTGDVSGYNVPGAFSKKGGSHKGVAGSAALGYELTPQGKKDMARKGDPIYNENKQ